MEVYRKFFLSLQEIQSSIIHIKVVQIARKTRYLDSLFSLIEKINKFLYIKNEILLELNIAFVNDQTIYDKLYNLYLNSISKSFDFICSDFRHITLAPEIVSNDKLFTSLYKQIEEKLYTQAKLPRESYDIRNNDFIQPEEIGLLHAYNLYLIKCFLEENNMMISNPIKYFYYYDNLLEYILRKNIRDDQDLRKVYLKASDFTFLERIKGTSTDSIEDILDHHFVFFQRNKGDKSDWLNHTEVLLQKNLDKKREEIVDAWLKKRTIPNSSKSKKKLEIDSWEQLIKPELYVRLSDIETKIAKKVDEWKSGNDKIGCASFCELLLEKGYFNKTKFTRKTLKLFALHKYNTVIEVQLNTSNNEARKNRKRGLNQHF